MLLQNIIWKRRITRNNLTQEAKHTWLIRKDTIKYMIVFTVAPRVLLYWQALFVSLWQGLLAFTLADLAG